MSALVSAELLRLRTIRSPRYATLGLLALVAVIAANMAAVSKGQDLAAGLQSVGLIAVFAAAVWGANSVGEAFRLGAAAMTYLVHPHRGRVMAARLVTYA